MDEIEERVPPIINPAMDHILTNEIGGNCAFLLEKAKIEYFTGNFIECFRTYSNYFELLIEPNSAPEDDQRQYIYCVLKLGEIEQNRNNFLQAIYYYLHAINMKLDNCHLVLNALGVCLLKEGQIKSARLYFEQALKLKPDYSTAAKNLQEMRFNRLSQQQSKTNDNLLCKSYLNAIRQAVIEKNVKSILEFYSGTGFLSHSISKHFKNVSITALECNSKSFKIAKDFLANCKVNLICSNLNQFKHRQSFDLIVLHLFNYSFFDELLLDDLITVNNRFGDHFTIIPNECEFFTTAIQCFDLIKSKRLINCVPELNLLNTCITSRNFSKTHENLSLCNANVQYLTRSASIFKSNLKNANFFRKIKDTNRSGNFFGKELCLKVLQDGVLHAFVVWIDLNLYKDFFISNNPKTENQTAQQAIFYLDHPILVKAGQNLEVKVEFAKCKLKMSIYNFPDKCCDCLQVQQNVISFLNDIKLVNTYRKLANYLMKNRFKRILENTNFPLLSIIMAKSGLKTYYKPTLVTDLKFLDYLINLNKISRDNFVIFGDDKDKLKFPFEFDVEITEPINSLGILNRKFKNKSLFCKFSLPKKILLQFVLIRLPFVEELTTTEELNEITLEESQFCEISTVGSIQLQKQDFSGTVDLEMLETSRINGIYYWFEMEYFKNITYSTLDSSYFKKNCVVLETSSVIDINSIVSVHISFSGEEFPQFKIKY